MQPEACTTPPQGDGKSMEELFCAGWGVPWSNWLSYGLANGFNVNGSNGVICKPSQHLGHNWHKLNSCYSAGRKMWGQLALDSNLESMAWSVGCIMTVCYCRGEITCTSNAAGWPRLQVGRRMSAGLERESGTTLIASRKGARAADWEAENKTLRIALWHVILSPLPPHPTWCSPNSSAVFQHSGQVYGPLWSGTPSQYLRQQRNSQSCRCRPKADEDTSFSQYYISTSTHAHKKAGR